MWCGRYEPQIIPSQITRHKHGYVEVVINENIYMDTYIHKIYIRIRNTNIF
jgi:hypothetical protein